MQISDEAIEAGAKAYRKVYGTWAIPDHVAKIILEAAAPILLSHERQLTADAHRDAIVNRDTVDRLERELETAKADAWDRCAASIVDEHGNRLIPYENTNPYRSQA
jgi:dihydropteroate synthase